MEKTSILDFIAKLTGSNPSESKTDEQKTEDAAEKKEPEQNGKDSFMRSYNQHLTYSQPLIFTT